MDTVTIYINEVLKSVFFPDSLKCANVRPIYKKDDLFYKKFIKVIYEQAQIILNLSSPKFCMDLSKLLNWWQNLFDRGGFVGFNFQAYGFSKESIRLFLSYLANRTHKKNRFNI